MKNVFRIMLLITLLTGCKTTETEPNVDKNQGQDDPALKSGLANGAWTDTLSAGGFNNFASFKNFHYTFTVENPNQKVSIELTSPDIDVKYALYNALGQQIGTSTTSKSISQEVTLSPGERPHRLVVTADRQAVGTFKLKVGGAKDGLTRLPFNILRSQKQSWGDLGGAGPNKSFKNHFYTFDVTDDNTSIDIELQSADTEVALLLYDSNGSVANTVGGQRYVYTIPAVKKGTYTVMAATSQRGNVGDYNCNVYGKVANLKRVSANAETKSDTWPAGKVGETAQVYSLDITSTGNSPLDIALSSGDVNVFLQLQDGSEKLITNTTSTAKSTYLLNQDLPKGTYRIRVRPAGTETATNPSQSSNSAGGAYKLSVFGQFANLKKL
jgi:hypothetical protein